MKIIRNYFYNVSYNILIIIAPLLTVPYISRVLGPTGVGINASTNSVITYFLLAGTVGITLYGNREIAFVRDDFSKRSKIFWEIEFLQMITISLSYICFLIFLFFEKLFKIYFFYQSFFVIAGAFDISWYFMGLEDFKKTVLRSIVIKVVSLIAIFSFVKTQNDTGIYILILSGSQLLSNLILWPYLPKIVKKPILKELSPFKHLRSSITLFIPQIATTIYLSVNKTMLWKLDSVTASGYYDYSDKLVKLLLALVTATGTVMLPHIANLYMKDEIEKVKKYLYTSFDFVLAISIPMSCGIIAIATTLAPWFFGAKFSSVSILLMIEAPVVVFIGMSNVLGQQFLLPTRQTKSYTISVTLGAIVNIVFNVPLILLWGVKGAMVATLLSEFCVTAYQMFVTRKKLEFRKLMFNSIKYIFAGLCMLIVVFMLNTTMKLTVINLVEQIVEGILIYCGILFILQPSIFSRLKSIK